MKKFNQLKKEVYKNSPLDQANLDLHFVEAFVDMLWSLSEQKGELDTLKTSTVSAMCYESKFKIDNLKNFIDGIAIDTEGNMYEYARPRAVKKVGGVNEQFKKVTGKPDKKVRAA